MGHYQWAMRIERAAARSKAVGGGIELCKPCASLGRRLATSVVSPAAVVAAFAHRAGRAVESCREAPRAG